MFNTRIAPSPTGMFHIGTARTALLNWLAARATGGTFTLRIDDTDSARSSTDSLRDIVDGMTWLGLDNDVMVHQSARLDRYRSLADAHATSRDGDALLIDDLVILKSNGMPTYHWASVVDDYDMDINYIIRGTDHVSNLPKHKKLWSTFADRDFPDVVHVGLIRKDGKKMSKRDGAASVLDLRDNGYSAAAVLNFLVRMGWAPREDNKANSVLTVDDMLRLFVDDGKLRPADSNFDQAKLDWFNKKHR